MNPEVAQDRKEWANGVLAPLGWSPVLPSGLLDSAVPLTFHRWSGSNSPSKGQHNRNTLNTIIAL
jgi:hypothetical protein